MTDTGTLKDRILKLSFGDNFEDVKRKTIRYRLNGDIMGEANTEINEVMVKFFNNFLPRHSFLGKLFKTKRESPPYTEKELASKLVQLRVVKTYEEAHEYLPELLKFRASLYPDGGFCFEKIDFEREKPLYKAVGNIHIDSA